MRIKRVACLAVMLLVVFLSCDVAKFENINIEIMTENICGKYILLSILGDKVTHYDTSIINVDLRNEYKRRYDQELDTRSKQNMTINEDGSVTINGEFPEIKIDAKDNNYRNLEHISPMNNKDKLTYIYKIADVFLSTDSSAEIAFLEMRTDDVWVHRKLIFKSPTKLTNQDNKYIVNKDNLLYDFPVGSFIYIDNNGIYAIYKYNPEIAKYQVIEYKSVSETEYMNYVEFESTSN